MYLSLLYLKLTVTFVNFSFLRKINKDCGTDLDDYKIGVSPMVQETGVQSQVGSYQRL